MATGQVKLFGTIQLTNYANIYGGGKINGVQGEALGQSANAQVNGSPAFITQANRFIIQGNTSEDNCANSASTYYTSSLGSLDGALIFDNASGFTQQSLVGQYFRLDGTTTQYLMGAFDSRSGYYNLENVGDCRG